MRLTTHKIVRHFPGAGPTAMLTLATRGAYPNDKYAISNEEDIFLSAQLAAVIGVLCRG